ncbi:MAG: C40 family peptidase [candidate division FCPU426 bacterium]
MSRSRILLCLILLFSLAGESQALRRRDAEGPEPAKLRRSGENLRQLFFGQAVLREARRHLGEPYVWGAKDGKEGFDCSGYTQYVFKTFGVELPQNSLGQYQQGIPIEKPSLMPGDLVFFASSRAPLHVGIYEGNMAFLHAPSDGKVISEGSMEKGYFADRYIGARRFIQNPSPAKETQP